jgi:hypothetical protein
MPIFFNINSEVKSVRNGKSIINKSMNATYNGKELDIREYNKNKQVLHKHLKKLLPLSLKKNKKPLEKRLLLDFGNKYKKTKKNNKSKSKKVKVKSKKV